MNQLIKFYKQSRKVFLAVFFFALITVTIAPAVLAEEKTATSPWNAGNTGLETTAKQGYMGNKETELSKVPTNVAETIGTVVGAGLAFVGIVFLILMIYGGVVWMFAQGNEQEVTKAKGLIFSAVIGLIIVLGAYAITKYVGTVVGQ